MLDSLDELEVRGEQCTLTAMDEAVVGYRWHCEVLTLALQKVEGVGSTPQDALLNALRGVSNCAHALPPTETDA